MRGIQFVLSIQLLTIAEQANASDGFANRIK